MKQLTRFHFSTITLPYTYFFKIKLDRGKRTSFTEEKALLEPKKERRKLERSSDQLGLEPTVHIIVGNVVLCEPNVHGHKGPDGAGHHPAAVEDDGGGHHQPHIGEEACVIHVEEPTRGAGALLRHADAPAPLLLLAGVALRTGRTVVRAVPITAIAGLRACAIEVLERKNGQNFSVL